MTGTEKRDEDWLWLCCLPGLYRKDRMVLLHYYGSPQMVRENMPAEIGLWKKNDVCGWAASAEKVLAQGDSFFEDAIRRMEKSGTRFVSIEDGAYPSLLKEIADPPYGLFYRGKLPAEGLRCAVVGARACTEYGAAMAQELCRMISSCHIPVISGMAAGIDGIAAQAALDAGGESYAILGCGCDICYPRAHIELFEALMESGGLISEYPCGTPGFRTHFPMRNRIISGISNVVVVVEARRKSGSLITADCAIDQGREVYAVPGRSSDPLSYGCNHLIEQGAGVIVDVASFRETLEDQFPDHFKSEKISKKRKSSDKSGLAPADELVYSNLDLAPVSLEELSRRTDLPVRQVSVIVTGLVLNGYAAESVRGLYRRLP